MVIINHDHPAYRKRWYDNKNRFNGAFFYSKEICKNMIPYINTYRNWITINIPPIGIDNSIVFIHNNKHPENYDWLGRYTDLILVCGIPETVEKVKHLGNAIYLPLSVDVKRVELYSCEKTKDVAFVGRMAKRMGYIFPPNTDYIENMPRNKLLAEMAKYRKVYAVGRAAIEAKVLGCEVLPYDERFPDPDIWKIVDNRDAAKILQTALNEIDGEMED